MRSAFLFVPVFGLGMAVSGCSGASARDCQYGQYWDAATETCLQGGGQCPQGMQWNGQTCVQGGGQQCPQGMMWNGQTCVAGGSPQCPQGTMWNGQTCAAGGAPNCPQGTVWNGQNCAPGAGPQCPAGQQWNGQACVAGGGFPGMGSACQPAGQLDPVSNQALQAAVMGYGQQQAAGAQPVGGMISGNFQAGQCVEVQVTLQAGKCYTAVGLGAPGEEVELTLGAPLPGGVPVPPFAQDQGTGNNAVLGGSPNCFRAMFPTPAKFTLKVSSGQGPAGAQLYER